MIVGKKNLLKLFPNFADDIQQNGIDLRVGELYKIREKKSSVVGCINDEKVLPNLYKVEPDNKGVYILKPKTFYFVKVDREIEIPKGYTQTYLIRSTFARCGVVLLSSVGDDGFKGTLMMGLYNTNNEMPICMGKNERIIQAVTYLNDGTASQYDGSYQNNAIYED